MFQRAKMTAEMSQRLIEALTHDGERDLTQLRLDDLERELYEMVDTISVRTLRGVLEDQAQSCQAERCCPKCGRELDDKPPEPASLTCGRGEVEWEQPVRRCKFCRCDFFPSGESPGN